jgi:hypothetical protein
MTCEAFRDDLLDVLYGEAAPEASRRFADHQEGCQACRQELRDLGALRGELRTWRLPVPQPRRITGALPSRPSWLLVAATVLLSVGASALFSRARLDRQDGRTAVRFDAGEQHLARQLAAQEARHRQEMALLKASLVPQGGGVDDERVLRKVQELLRESESRQGIVLEARLSDLATRSEAQRRYDLAQMSAGLNYLDGKTGLQAARTTELVGHILQASQQR